MPYSIGRKALNSLNTPQQIVLGNAAGNKLSVVNGR